MYGPENRRTYLVIHECATLQKHGSIVGKLSFINSRAIRQMGTIIDIVVLSDVTKSPYQIPSFLGQFSIGGVVCITGKSSAYIEVAGIGNS